MSTPVTLFKNQNGNCNAVLRSGAVIAFISGKYFTTKAGLQAELQAAADNENEFGIYVDPQEPTIDPEFASPMDQMRKKIRDELMAELKAGGKLVDAGISTGTLTQQAITTSQQVAGQGGVSDEQQTLATEQTAAIEEGSKDPVDTRTPAQIQLDKLKAGK